MLTENDRQRGLSGSVAGGKGWGFIRLQGRSRCNVRMHLDAEDSTGGDSGKSLSPTS